MARDPVPVSIDLLSGVRRDESIESFETTIEEYDLQALESRLDADDKRKAFWCNLYNAYAQLLLDRERDTYLESKRQFFALDAVPVAGAELSLNDIEHQLLRRSRFRWALGYLANPFVGDLEARLRVETVDPRIHFALNCGAESCPPIATYSADGIDTELDRATGSYLSQTVSYEPSGALCGTSIVKVPRLLLWYRGDFGGKSGILEVLREFDQLPADASPRLKHRPYDWSLAPGRYRDMVGE